jgi:hypothetical protein
MKEVSFENLTYNKIYYIQSPLCTGTRKKKGVFIKNHYSHFGIIWCEFEKVENVLDNSGYGLETRKFRCDFCTFYECNKDWIIEKNLVNGVLKSITGDPCFEYYVTPRK